MVAVRVRVVEARTLIETECFVLAPTASIVPARTLSAEVRSRLGVGATDAIVVDRLARRRARVLDEAAVAFVERFRQPSTFAAAATPLRASDAEAAEALFRRLVADAVLVSPDVAARSNGEPSLRVGSVEGDYRILRCVRMLADGEVYQAHSPRHGLVALKIAHAHSSGAHPAFERETAVLSLLSGPPAPDLCEYGRLHEARFIATRWQWGLNPLVAPRREADFLNLALEIVRSYHEIHTRGVVHGDVRPENLVVSDDGVTVLDFGLAELEGWPSPGRGGIEIFMEPEYARACVSGDAPPRASRRGEIYAVGALLYLLVARKPYLEFSFDRMTALHQIAEASQTPLSVYGVQWPALDEALRTALAKDPGDRFRSMDEFATALESLVPRRSPGAAVNRYRRYLDDGLEALDHAAEEELPARSSLAFGAAGVAHVLYRSACLDQDARLLERAERWVKRAEDGCGQKDAFAVPSASSSGAGRPGSPFLGEAGVHLVRLVVARSLDDTAGMHAAFGRLLECVRAAGAGTDLVSGTAGALLACAVAVDALSGASPSDLAPLIDAGETVSAGLLGAPEPSFLGMAHGRAGILYALLRWARATRIAPGEEVRARLEALGSAAVARGGRVSWPVASDGLPRFLLGWCHGSAGHVHLWNLAAEATDDERYRELALRAAVDTSTAPASPPQLCCGSTGQALALLELYQSSGDRGWLVRAQGLADRALGERHVGPPLASGLHKGALGNVLLALAMEHHLDGGRPLFERCL